MNDNGDENIENAMFSALFFYVKKAQKNITFLTNKQRQQRSELPIQERQARNFNACEKCL